ncbi:TRAP transporter small permease [Evansella sp. AB-P1]|uniref:TRAP transporter small permease n=1 Tax=Evansella sp. AB-P1 TaxID=3037653 RepID=UPI00241D64E2|nr:TRAP transporter small permease [Evansella sp. AB-P1]MDG5787133.1 TRAP transporter small permease [Evansella sp. AB-P1]
MVAINRLFNYLEEYIAVILLIFTSLLVFIQVVLRYLFNFSLYWGDEVARYLIIWFIFIGSSIAVREKAHATVDLLIVALTQKWKLIVGIVAYFISMIFCVLLVYASWGTIGNVMNYGTITPALGIPMYIPYLAIPVGASLMFIRFAQAIFYNLKELGKPHVEKGGSK